MRRGCWADVRGGCWDSAGQTKGAANIPVPRSGEAAPYVCTTTNELRMPEGRKQGCDGGHRCFDKHRASCRWCPNSLQTSGVRFDQLVEVVGFGVVPREVWIADPPVVVDARRVDVVVVDIGQGDRLGG